MLKQMEESLERQEEGNDPPMVGISSQDVHMIKGNVEGGCNSKEGCEILPIDGSDGHLGKRKRGVEEGEYMEDIQGKYKEGSQVNSTEYLPHDNEEEKGDAKRIMRIRGRRCAGKNPPPMNRRNTRKSVQLEEDNIDGENIPLEDGDKETEMLMSKDQEGNIVMEEYEDNLSDASSAQSNYGKYKDVDPDDLIYLYENENMGNFKSTKELATTEGVAEATTEEPEEEVPVSRYLDKDYKGQIIIDGKNEVDELLLATRMAYFDMANQNRDSAPELIKQNTSVDFLKANKDEENESSVDCSEDEASDRDESVEQFRHSDEDGSVHDDEQPVCDPIVHISGSPGESDKQEGQNADADGEEGKGTGEVINDDSEDGMIKSTTNGEINGVKNGADNGDTLNQDQAESTMMDKSAKCVFPEEKNPFNKQSRIRLMGAPESVKEDIPIEKIGKLIKLQDDVLTVHAFKCEYYLSVASVLCLDNRRIIGCIINVSSNETEIFYYARVLFPNVKNELTPNIDIYVDKKHAVYMNVGVNICSELFKVFRNPAIPFVFINYKDLYNIADAQLAQSTNGNQQEGGADTDEDEINSGKQNEHTMSDWLRNLALSTTTSAGKNANKSWRRNVSSQNVTLYDSTNRNKNYQSYGKNYSSPRARAGRNYAYVSSRRPSNYRFKNMSYVTSVRDNKMTSLHGSASASLSTRGGENGAYVGAPIMNGNVSYGHDIHMSSSYNYKDAQNYGSGTPHDASISEMQSSHATYSTEAREPNAHSHQTYRLPSWPPQYNQQFSSHDYSKMTVLSSHDERRSAYPGESTNYTHRGSFYSMHKTNHATYRTNRYLYNKMKRGPPFRNITIVNSNDRGSFKTEEK